MYAFLLSVASKVVPAEERRNIWKRYLPPLPSAGTHHPEHATGSSLLLLGVVPSCFHRMHRSARRHSSEKENGIDVWWAGRRQYFRGGIYEYECVSFQNISISEEEFLSTRQCRILPLERKVIEFKQLDMDRHAFACPAHSK